MEKKFEVKDLISVGVFTALYFVVFFVTSFIGMVPVCMVILPFVMPIVGGIPLMLFFTKIKHFGLLTISGILLGLISFLLTSFSWVIVVTSSSAGLLADLALKAGSYKSIKNCIIASAVYSLWGIGTYISLFFGFRQVYLKSIVDGYGQEYVDKLSAYTPSYMFYVMLAMTFVGGLIGGALGTKVLNKHFRKAGIA